jgi:hypothetical protein
LRAVIANPPGSTAPGSAATTRSPSAKFVAPQMMPRTRDSGLSSGRSSASATSTMQYRIGFLNSVSSVISTTRPTTTGPVTGPSGVTLSTSSPTRTNASASCSAVNCCVVSKCSVSQLTGTRTVFLSY